MIFARFATGFRPGGPNIAVLGLPPVYSPDTTENFEAGIKSKFWNGKGSVDITGYYTKWEDIIVATGVGGISGAGNAGNARIFGVESSLTLRPLTGLSVTGALAYSNAELNRVNPASVGTGAVGDPLPNNPRWSGSLVADYRFPIGGTWQGTIGGSARFAGKRHAALRSGFVPDYVMPGYALFDLRGGVTSGAIDIDLFLRNLTDERAQLGALTQYGLAEVTVQRPRTYGLSVTARY
jgi:iron complex outermembrane recepter protein